MTLTPEKILQGYYIFALLVAWPAIVICRRAGVKPVWTATLLVPILGLTVYSCALAFQRWSRQTIETTQ